MENIFISLLNTSITAGYLVLAVLVLRPILTKAPKYIRCILWGLVGLRLVLPFSPESVFSLIPSAEPVPPEIVYSPTPTVHTGVALFNSTINPVLTESMAPSPEASVNPMQIVMGIAWNVWLLGMIAMVLCSIISVILLKRRLREAVHQEQNIWLCDRIGSPFLLGLFRPRIYLPSDLEESHRQYVLAHENAHIHRKDHWWKPLGFLLLTVYWFHPLMWAAYILLCRDIEFACDEKVIKELGTNCKASYSEALIGCSIPKKMISACPVAFGEGSIKGRIKSVLNYKKPAFWMILIALILCVVVAVCFLTNPYSTTDIIGNRFETGKCLYSNVISKEKETETNELVFDFHSNLEVYKEVLTGQREYIGILYSSNYSEEMLNSTLLSQSADSHISIGRVKNTYEIQDTTGQLKYVFFQKYNGKVIMVSFFSDGKIMNVFRLNLSEECPFKNTTHNYQFRATVLEVYDGTLLVKPLDPQGIQIADQIVVTIPKNNTDTFAVDDWIQVHYDGMVQELYPPILPNVSTIWILNPFKSTRYPSDYAYVYGAIDQAEFDIDNDGIAEYCALTYGPTSGLFTFVMTAFQNGVPEYRNIFNSAYPKISFRTLDNGKTVLVSAPQWENTTEQTFDISIKDSVIVLSDGTETMAYWGNAAQFYGPTIADVKKDFPHFLNLPTAKGLEVYVWKNGNWRCGVRGGTNRNATMEEYRAFGNGASLNEMALILSTYGIQTEEVAISYSYDPAFSGGAPNSPSEKDQEMIEQTLFAYLPRHINAEPYVSPEFSVQKKYPVIVYAFQLGEHYWRYLIYKNNTIFDTVKDVVMGFHSIDAEEARNILTALDLPPEEIPVIPINSYISSYYYEINQQTAAEARTVLGLS